MDELYTMTNSKKMEDMKRYEEYMLKMYCGDPEFDVQEDSEKKEEMREYLKSIRMELECKDPDLIDWILLCGNPEHWMLRLFRSNPEHLFWEYLIDDVADWMLPLLMDYPEYIPWNKLEQKFSPWMLPLLIENINRFDWLWITELFEPWMQPLLDAKLLSERE